MQRGFLQNGGYTTDSREPEHVASLRALLEKEEDRLRQLRQRRLQIENSKVDPPSRVLELPCEGPDEMAMKALALHTEPPPAALHRLGVAVMLVLEDRESDNVAQGRAEAAEAWLLDAGIPSERLTVSWEVGGPAVCRRTDFRLMDVVGSELVMRRKAEDVMKRIFEKQTLHESSERPAPTEGSSRNEGPEQGRSEEDAAPPANPVELKRVVEDAEESSTSSSPTVSMEVSGQQVRLVFKKDDLAPHDAILEVGTKIVRLASQSSSWPQKEVVLPFDVQPEEPAAKFSRRAGTLTLTLAAAG
eukprot:g6570.t1